MFEQPLCLFLPWSLPLTLFAPLLKNYSAIPYCLWIKSQFHCLPFKAIPAARLHPLPLFLQGNGLCSSPMGWFTTSQAMPILLALCLVHGTSSAWWNSSEPLYSCAPTCSWWTLSQPSKPSSGPASRQSLLTSRREETDCSFSCMLSTPLGLSLQPFLQLPWTVRSSLEVHFPSTRLQARGTETTFYLALYHLPQSVSFGGT